MTSRQKSSRDKRGSRARTAIAIWFAIDGVVALAPPLYWAADGRATPILGIPAAILYFLAVAVCVAASVVVAGLAEDREVAA